MGMNRFRAFVLLGVTLNLSACVAAAPTGPGVTPEGSPTTPPSAGATTAPPSGAPASVGPSSDGGTAVGEVTTLRGRVYDEAGANVPDGTRVIVHSLDTSRPFDTTVETRGGAYVVNGAPVGAALEIAATRDGWTRRTRVEVLRSNTTNLDRRNVFNFGGDDDANDPAGPNYFISNYPEIERVEPSSESTSQSNQQMSFKLVMSEALDVTNQRRLASAFLIVPNNEESLADDAALPEETATSTELRGLRAGASPITTSAYRYRQNSGFLNGAVVSSFKWETDNRTATFTLDAPVKTSSDEEGQYAFLLVQQDDESIKDQQGKALGMNDQGEFGRTLRNQVIHNAVRETDVSLGIRGVIDGEDRWMDTHVSYTTFSVSRDTEAPRLVGVMARRNYVDDNSVAVDRIEMTFSEPMIAYPRVSGSQLLSLNNYIIAAAETQAEIDARTLSDDGSAASIAVGTPFEDAREAIEGTTGGVIGANADRVSGNYSIALSVKDPKVVILDLPAGALPLAANFIKVYVGSDDNAPGRAGRTVTDPAGNPVATNGRTMSGSIQ